MGIAKVHRPSKIFSRFTACQRILDDHLIASTRAEMLMMVSADNRSPRQPCLECWPDPKAEDAS